MGKRKNTDHIGIGDGGRLTCLHCGGTDNPHGDTGAPVEIRLLASIAKAFTTKHAGCPKPAKQRCPFCLTPDHAADEHINATTTRADEWPTCRDTGMSSRAIWAHMTGSPQDTSWGPRAPSDPDDFGRCFRLLAAPWAMGWRARLGEMTKYPGWAPLVAAWDELEALYREELPRGRAPKLYARMKTLRGETR